MHDASFQCADYWQRVIHTHADPYSCGELRNAGTAAGKQCTLQCLKQKNASLVFVDAKSKKVMKIENQDSVNTDKDLGMEVNVTGKMMEGDTIHVNKITMGKM